MNRAQSIGVFMLFLGSGLIGSRPFNTTPGALMTFFLLGLGAILLIGGASGLAGQYASTRRRSADKQRKGHTK